MARRRKKQSNSKGEKDMPAVLSLDRYKVDADIKNIPLNAKEYCLKYIDEVIEFETNFSGIDEFEESLEERRKNE